MFDRLKKLVEEMDSSISRMELDKGFDEFDEGCLSTKKEISKKLKAILSDAMDDMK